MQIYENREDKYSIKESIHILNFHYVIPFVLLNKIINSNGNCNGNGKSRNGSQKSNDSRFNPLNIISGNSLLFIICAT